MVVVREVYPNYNPGTFIWIDNLGIIYVIDSLNFRVQIFDKNGSLSKSTNLFKHQFFKSNVHTILNYY